MKPLHRLFTWFRTPHLIHRPAAVLLLVVLPIMIGITWFIGNISAGLLKDEALGKLETLNRTIADGTITWLNFNILALQQMVRQEEIWEMAAEAQKPVLQNMAALYPHMYLVSTTDLQGINLARSDADENRDYSARQWFQSASNGSPTTFQTLIGATSGQPAVVVSIPIRNAQGELVGVGMFASDLDAISEQVQAARLGETGFTYIVDEQNRIVAHPDPDVTADLRDASQFPAVVKLRQGYDGLIQFTENDINWLASVMLLPNGWGVISQQQENEIFAPIAEAQRASFLLIFGGLSVVFIVFTVVARSVIRPISALTETAVAISLGDLKRRVRVEGKDEVGLLAQSFNEMADQLQAIQANLEHQVTERTSALAERTTELEINATQLSASAAELDERSAYLQTVADVSRIVATILDPDELMEQVVELMRERFNLYYVGLFLADAKRERATLMAGTGLAGRAMLGRKHAIQIGTGMIGWCIEHAQPRIALQVGEDKVRLATPDLPDTRSEAALPLRSREVVIGAFSIQSAIPDDFDEENIAVFQLLADQVAIALDNARLYRESQDALRSLRESYGQQNEEGWKRLLQTRANLAFRSDAQGLTRANEIWYPEMDKALQQGDLIVPYDAPGEEIPLAIPIKVRGQVVGVLDARKEVDSGRWQLDDVTLLKTVVEQLGAALESAQLYQETQNRAERERLVAEITGKLRASNDPREILQTAASELRRVLHVKDARVMLRNLTQSSEDGGDEIGVTAGQSLTQTGQE